MTTMLGGVTIDPKSTKIDTVEDEPFIKIRDAARLSGLHPVAIEMADKLIPLAGKGVARFKLGTKELENAAEDIEAQLQTEISKAVKLLNTDDKYNYRVKSIKSEKTLMFWLEQRGRWSHKKGKGKV